MNAQATMGEAAQGMVAAVEDTSLEMMGGNSTMHLHPATISAINATLMNNTLLQIRLTEAILADPPGVALGPHIMILEAGTSREEEITCRNRFHPLTLQGITIPTLLLDGIDHFAM